MEIENGTLEVVRQEGEENRFAFALNDKAVYFVPQTWHSEDGPFVSAMLMTFSIFDFSGDEFEIIKKVYAEKSRLMELYFQIVIHDSQDFPYPKWAIQSLLDFNLTDDEVEIVRRRLKEFTFIYLIRDKTTGFTKIGISSDPERRLKQLIRQDTLLPHANEFSILLCWEDYPYIEKVLHEKYSDRRVRGEWFNLSSDDIDTITNKYVQ